MKIRLLLLLLFQFLLYCLHPGSLTSSQIVVCDDVKDPPTLDPHKQFTEKNHTLIQQIYEGLVRFSPNGHIESALATHWERKDPLRVRFYLRQGITFHNGEVFNADDVKFSIERYLKPETGFPAQGFINSLDKVEIIDDYTIDIVTKFPDGLLLNRLAGFIVIIPHDYIEKEGENILSSTPIGTGPFIFVNWDKGKQITLTKNTNYWSHEFPKFDKLIFKFIPWDKQLNQLIKGKVDILTELPGTQTTMVMDSKVAKIIKEETYYTMTGVFNSTKGALQDKRIRKAINYAINRTELIRFDALGNGRSIATFSMPGEQGYNKTLTPYPYDIKKCTDLLKDAGYENKPIKLKMLVKDQSLRAARIIAKQLSAINIVVEITVTTDADILKDTKSESWDILFGALPDPMCHSYFIQSITLYSKSPYSLGKVDKFDKLLEDMVVTIDIKEREQKEQAIDKFIYDEALGIFTYQRIKTYGVNLKVDFNPSVTGMPHFFTAKTNEQN